MGRGERGRSTRGGCCGIVGVVSYKKGIAFGRRERGRSTRGGCCGMVGVVSHRKGITFGRRERDRSCGERSVRLIRKATTRRTS
jgi:hypothetical protein